MKKRMLTMLLALVMIVSVLPFSAMAEEAECDHSAGEYWLESKPGDCLHEGAVNFICKECGEIARRQPSEEGFGPHNYKDSKCTVCGDVCKKHDYSDKVTVDPTCTKDGSDTRTCQKCGYKEVKVKAATGHNFKEAVNGRVATCTVDGYSAHKKCTVCGEKNSDYTVIAAKGHVLENVTDKAATCTKDGVLEQKCKNCEYVTSETRKKTGHSYSDVAAADPTCTEEGHSAYKKCDNCGKVTGKTSIAAIGHTYVNGQCACGLAAPDYSGPTKPNSKCQHPSKSTYTTSPDCTNVGYTVITCDDCHIELDRQIIPAIGHNNETITRNPTCTRDGFERVACTVCGTTESYDVLYHYGHNFIEGICAACGAADTNKYTHDFQDVYIVG